MQREILEKNTRTNQRDATNSGWKVHNNHLTKSCSKRITPEENNEGKNRDEINGKKEL